MVSRYVKQEGICLVPPHHYRMMPPQRSDGFGVPNQQGGYAPPPPQQQQVVVNQQQGPPPGGMRGIPQGQNGPPPNQAPTPPNVADPMKVQSLQQQPPSMNHMFLQQQVRTTAPAYYQRAAGPPNQGPRMPNHNNRPQQPPPLFNPQPQPQYVIQQPVYITTNSGVQYQSYTQRPPGFVQQLTAAQAVYHGPPMTFNPYNNPPNPQNQVYNMNNYYSTQVMRQPTAPPVTPNNVLPSVPMAPSIPQHQPPFQRPLPNKRRANALAIIDPDTGADRLQEIFDDNSHPPSGDSSARQTPQPPAAAPNSKEVQAAFAKQVMQALEGRSQEPSEQLPQQQQQQQQGPPPSEVGQPHLPAIGPHNHVEMSAPPPQQAYLAPAGPPPPASKMEHVVQASKLQPGAKEFVLPSSAAKDTPIVSANCDAVEVTLANKPPKERESPAKGRPKARAEQPLPPPMAAQPPAREQRESLKEVPVPLPVEKEVPVEGKAEAEPVPVQPTPKHAEPQAAAAVATPTVVPTAPKEAPPKEPLPQVERKKKDAKPDAAAPQHQAQDGGNVAKKQNAQRAATKQQQAPAASTPAPASKQNSHRAVAAPVVVATVVAPVPQPQPPKPAGKAHKKHELNQKGANKEGTDMDAFNDNSHIDKEANCNVINETIEAPTPAPVPTPTPNDIINANSIVAPVEEVVPPTATVEVNKNEPPAPQPAAAAAPKPAAEPTVKKSNFNITDIVRDTPKPFVSPPAAPAAMVGGQDEPDRAAIAAHGSNEKLGQPSRSDVVAGKSGDGARGGDKKLPYRDGQWSPANQQGSMVYQRDFLLALKDAPASRKVPDNIPEVVFMLEDNNRGRLSDGRSSMGGRSDFTPSFNNYGGKSSSQRGVIPKRPSQGKMDSRSGKSSKPMMKVSLSVREDVKLHEAENAWRPARIKKGDDNLSLSEEDRKTDELYKKVRGILNKLTPQKFDTLLMQIKNLPIDNSSRLQGVIDLVFEKAVDEPNFSVAYANMCKELALMQVPTASSTAEKQEFVNFRKLLITRCQVEFEKNSIDEEERNKKVQEIEDTEDPEKKKDLQFDLEEYDRKLRMKSVGNIRFIGELFKQNMLTVNIMMRCLSNLLDNKDEESLECLCKLLTTVGKELESKQVNLQPIFGPMRDIISKRQEPKVSSRIRFMLQDVMDLRQSKWVPRRQDFNPKTIDQIQKEAADEQLNIQIMNSGPMPQSSQQQQRKDDRMGGDRRGGGRGGGGGGKVGDEGWITMSNKGRSNDRMSVQNDRITVQKDKLKNWQPKADEPFGSPAMFGLWGKGSVGSNTKSTPQQSMTNTGNMYAALENMDGEKRGMGPRSSNNDSYHSKGNSLERNYHSKYDGRGSSRSGSQHRSNDGGGGGPSQRLSGPMGPPPVSAAPLGRPPAQPTPPAAAAPAPQPAVAEAAAAASAVSLTEDQIHRRVTNALEEFVSGNCSVNEYFEEISTDIPRSCIRGIIRDCYLHVLEKNSKVRQSTGSLFAALVSQARIDVEDYCFNLEDVLSQVEDLEIDIPKIWDYLAELMVDIVCMESVPMKRLHKSCSSLIGQKRADRLLAPLFKLVVSKKGPNFLQGVWNKSGLQLTDFMDSSIVDNFISNNKFEFLIGGATSAGESQLSYEDIQKKLSELLRINNNLDEITNWITANVGDKVKDKRFIRSLATAVFQDSIEEDKKLKLAKERLIHHSTLFIKYVDNNEEYELQCLYALQSLINRMEHPQGLLLSICETIYEMQTFSQETFVMWESSADPAEQEGKGVALKQLTSFFCQLKENDDEAEEESTGSEPEA